MKQYLDLCKNILENGIKKVLVKLKYLFVKIMK